MTVWTNKVILKFDAEQIQVLNAVMQKVQDAIREDPILQNYVCNLEVGGIQHDPDGCGFEHGRYHYLEKA